MAGLNRIEIAGFRSIGRTSLDLRSLNVLIGENGAGKSNLMDFFRLLRHLAEGELQSFVRREGSASTLLHFGPKRTQSIDLSLECDDGVWPLKYAARLGYAAGDTLFFEDERYWYRDSNRGGDWCEEELGGGHQESKVSPNAGVERPLIVEVYKMLSLPRVYHFHDTSPTAGLHQTTHVNDLARLRPHAENLAAVLNRLSRREPFYYRRIVKTINLVAPWFRDFDIEAFETKEGARVALHWRGEDPDYVLKSVQLPDGGIRAIALITLLLQPKANVPPILFIDEPELGLHPFVLNAIAGLIKAAALDCQIVLGTQSQALVDHFEPQDIVVVEREKEGTTFSRLDPERLHDWLAEYSLGELWEKNVIGGGPV